MASKCLACKTGYKPVVDETTKAITDCIKIENCDVSYLANGCSMCNQGYELHYDEQIKDLDYEVCHEALAAPHKENCQLFNTTTCFMCKVQFTLNSDGNCISNPNLSLIHI